MSRHARDREPPAGGHERAPGAPAAAPALRRESTAAVGVAVAISAAFVAIVVPALQMLPHDFDEAWLILGARAIQRGLRPFVDFPHHETPLHLYLLALSGDVFGSTLFGHRMLSLLSLAGGGLALFALARPCVGTIPALAAEALFLFSPVQIRSLTAVPETSGLFFTLVGAALLFTRDDRWSSAASAVAFVTAILIKPTCVVMALAAALALVWARRWSRLATFAAVGATAGIAGLAWVVHLSDGIFAEVIRAQVMRVGSRTVGMWAIDSGFTDLRHQLGIETPRQWAVVNFKTFFASRTETLPIALFWLALAAIPLWTFRCARARPALQAFVVLWPASYLLLDFTVMDFVSPRYFIPFFAFVAFLCAGWVWLAERVVGRLATAAAVAVAGVVLAIRLATIVGGEGDPWFLGRCRWIADQYPKVVSFNPMLFASTGTEPGCGLGNPALTYGELGKTFLLTESSRRRFHVSDDSIVQCLRAEPDVPVVVDWAFYFFTRPGSRLREYLAGEGSTHRLFFSPESVEQWDRPLLRMNPFR